MAHDRVTGVSEITTPIPARSYAASFPGIPACKDTVLIRVESIMENTTDSNEFRSKDGTVVRISDPDFNITLGSATKYTTPSFTRI
ncbi:hypothetical protein TNCV_4217471 [Trichonephila clavipes]|nr:hypothetical protein TNCV_4217471 [Trichonephila clavipes]